ncbi:MAG: hypothetical protein FJZ38_09895 [Candidatus Rokubacteria bacterium]|nr:hypothetical protein [Candidatus Rokubacteria bacterium]
MSEQRADGPRPLPVDQLYQFYRYEVKHEDDLIGQRINWFMAGQAFLLVALAIVHKGDAAMPSPINNPFFPMVPIVALIASVFIFAGVIAGTVALGHWRTAVRKLVREYPDLPYVQNEAWIVPAAWSGPLVTPLAFIAAWLYLLAHGYGILG